MITTEFNKFSFHDASVEKIVRNIGIISIQFENAFMNKDHSKANGTNWVIERGVLHLCDVTREESLFWYDNIEGKPHPEPQVPIDEIMSLEFNGKLFEFGGFLKSEPWAQWFVYATEFKLEIISKYVANN